MAWSATIADLSFVSLLYLLRYLPQYDFHYVPLTIPDSGSMYQTKKNELNPNVSYTKSLINHLIYENK